MYNAKRNSLSWLGSFAVHGAALSAMSIAVASVPVQIVFQRGQASIELQATMAAAPRAEPEPVPLEIEKPEEVKEVEETKPIELAAIDVDVEKETGKPPLPKRPDATEPESKEADTDETALAKAEPMPVETPPEVEVPPPPKRKQAEAKTDLPDAPIESAAQAASPAENGVEFDQPPQPHPYNTKPPYPADAYARRHEGIVMLSLHVDVDGDVDRVEIAQSSGFASLDDAAVEAARNWRYVPARRGGVSVAATFTQRVKFFF